MAKYKGRGETAEAWEQAFLERYATEGGISLSAKEAGVTWQYVKKRGEASPAFADKFETAQQEYGERLERKMMNLANGNKGVFLALMALLKGALPHKYNDKLQIAGVIGHVSAAPPPEVVNALLRSMLDDVMPETRAAIRGEVIDAADHTDTA